MQRLGIDASRLPAHLAEPEHRQRQVGERREIAGRSQRTLFVDNRMHTPVDEENQAIDQLGRDAGKPAGQAVDLEQQH